MNRFGLILLLGTALACGRERSAAPVDGRIQEAIPRLEQAIGMKFKTPPKFEMRSKEEVRAFLEQQFTTSLPEGELDGSERAYKRFGMIPDSLNLKAFMLSLLTEQVAGFYDPATKVLYIVQGASDDMVNVTVAHELVHALQDQYFDLDSLRRITRQNDRQMAAQAVMEGQATLEQMSSMLGTGSALSELPGGWDRIREVIRDGQNAMPLFAAAPLVIQETLLFPYLSGAEFMKNWKTRNGARSPYEELPQSTEQVMHEDRFFGSRDVPTTITLPATPGAYENTLGEFETRILLFTHLKDRDGAYRGAAGWDGDRFVSVGTGAGDALGWLTVWDTAVDAAEFLDLMDTALLKRFASIRPGQSTGNRRSYSADGRTLTLQVAEVQGRSVVLYSDVPQGRSTDVIDLSKVRLQQ